VLQQPGSSHLQYSLSIEYKLGYEHQHSQIITNAIYSPIL
jgi:hypothetical protein